MSTQSKDFQPLKNGINCIYVIKGNQKINNDCAVYLKMLLVVKK